MKKRKKILIADDDKHVHEMLKAVLSFEEYEVIDSYDGRETMERIGADLPDLVVLDILMPIKDGRDICQSLKQDPKTKHIKILMLSARDQQYDRTTGLEIGADDYVTKPFFPSHLASKIKRMCSPE